MKRLSCFLLFLFLVIVYGAPAQDNRTAATRIADALALLPARDAAASSLAFAELMALDDDGLAAVVAGVRPSGDARGVPYRYAVSLLTQVAIKEGDRARVEKALLDGLAKSTQAEIKQYYLQHLSRTGTNRSVPAVASLLRDPALADASVGTLESIGTKEAMESLHKGLAGAPESLQVRIIQSMGALRDPSATELLTPYVKSGNIAISREALWTLALVGDPAAEPVLIERAAAAGYTSSPSRAMEALIQFMSVRASAGGNTATVRSQILASTLGADQQHYRIAALGDFVRADASGSQPVLVKELDRFDAAYRRDVLNVAVPGVRDPEVNAAWIKQYKKTKGDVQAEILAMLMKGGADANFMNQYVVPALDSKNQFVRITALRGLAATRQAKYADRVATVVVKPSLSADERNEAARAFLQLAEPIHVQSLAKQMPAAAPDIQLAILSIVTERRDSQDAAVVFGLTASPNTKVREAAYHALPYVAGAEALPKLLSLLATASTSQEVSDVQQAIIAVATPATAPVIFQAVSSQKARLLPVLPFLNDAQSLHVVKASFEEGVAPEKELAFAALINWQNGDAVPVLLALCRDAGNAKYHEKAYAAYVSQVMKTGWPADQKLLLLREIFPLATTAEQRRLVIREAGGVRTFLSLMFAASYLDDPELGNAASRSVMRLALPTPDGQSGLVGMEVRKALEKVMEKLTGPDSQYDRIDVQNYLDQMPFTQGFEPIFNGRDLTGWQGLVEDPIKRAKMTREELAQKQAVANSKMTDSWVVKEGMICYVNEGSNLCTTRSYGDFELLVDYRIGKKGDSGIYLRGTPQVQIWDISRVEDGAQVGSGGLYNNTTNRDPLVVTDNPIGDWNTLRITMIGDRVTVYQNGVLVVDHVVMENYWDRSLPIFPEGPIELQAHGTGPAFRNLYVRELNRTFKLTEAEKKEGYEVLFDGNDLSGWVGNKTDYVVDDHVIAIYPTGRGKGNLYTEKEYSDFVFRFEFQLTPAGNNGLGIHAPLEGDAAYVGKEIQILDDGHPTYADIQPWQVHGSVYGVIAAKRGVLRPVGEWNTEEVEVHGDKIKVTVNGTVIVDGDMRKASAKGTLDKKDHPGLQRHRGHIGFLGHGSVVRFRNIRIRDFAR